MIAVACDDEKDSVFRETVEAARSIEDFSHQRKTFLQRGAGRNPVHFPEDLVNWIRHADAARRFQENEGLDFDIVTATTGPWRGLRVVAIGSNKLKRKRAAEVALVVAIVQFYPQSVASQDVRSFQMRIHLVPFDNQSADEPRALGDETLALTDEPPALTDGAVTRRSGVSSKPEAERKPRPMQNKMPKVDV